MYIADGANIRVVSHTGIIDTLIGNQRLPTHWTPMPCDRPVPIDQVSSTVQYQLIIIIV